MTEKMASQSSIKFSDYPVQVKASEEVDGERGALGCIHTITSEASKGAIVCFGGSPEP